MLRNPIWTAFVQNTRYDLEREGQLLWLANSHFVVAPTSSDNLNWGGIHIAKLARAYTRKEWQMQKCTNENWLTRGDTSEFTAVPGGQSYAVRRPGDLLLSYSKIIPPALLHLLGHYLVNTSIKAQGLFCVHLSLLLVWAKITVSGVRDHVLNIREWNPDWWSTITCYGDMGTCRYIQAEAENISMKMSPNSLGYSKYGTASFCHKILCGPRLVF